MSHERLCFYIRESDNSHSRGAKTKEATARLRDARELRDQLDMAKEKIAELASEVSDLQQRNSQRLI